MSILQKATWGGRLLLLFGFVGVSLIVMGANQISRETREHPLRTFDAHLAQQEWSQAVLTELPSSPRNDWGRCARVVPLAVLQACSRPATGRTEQLP